MNYLEVGVHKSILEIAQVDDEGKLVSRSRVKNTPEAIEELAGSLSPEVKVAMESCSYFYPLYNQLEEAGVEVKVAHPMKVRLIAEARIKSDKIDTLVLTQLPRLDYLPTSYIPPRELAELREKIQRRAFIVRQGTKLKVKIRDVLVYEGAKPPTGYGLFTKKGVDWLKSLSLEPVDCYLRLMPPLSREVLLLSRELRGLTRDDPDVQLLVTILGVGYYIALLIKAEIGDVRQFRSGDHLASYAGLVPSTKSSGGVTKHRRITREGGRWIRWALVEVAMVHVRRDPQVARLYHRVVEHRGRKLGWWLQCVSWLLCVTVGW